MCNELRFFGTKRARADKMPGHGLIMANYLADMPHVEVRDPQDNAGPGIPGLSKDEVTPQEELAAFDQLGPLTRKVISELMCCPKRDPNI